MNFTWNAQIAAPDQSVSPWKEPMKLTHLALTSFRSFRGVELPLDASRVLIAGLNGAGKTSVADGIRWGLRGVCSGTDARGAGAEVLIPEGTKTADVTVTVDGIGQVARMYAERGGGAFSVEGFTGTSQIQQQALFIKLQTTPEFLDAVLDTSIFLDLNHVEAKAMVLSLLGVRFKVEGKDLTLDEIDVHYKQAFEDRKLSKKALAACVLPAKPTATMPTVDAIEAQLTKLRETLGALRQETGSVSGRRKALQDELGRLQAVVDAPAGEDRSAEIDGLQAKLESLEAAVVPVHTAAPVAGDPKRLPFLRSTVEAIQRHDPNNGCVMAGSIPCKTSAKVFSDRLAGFVAELKAIDPKPEKAPQAPRESPLTALRRQLQDLERQQTQRTVTLAGATRAEGRMQAIRQELDGLPSTDVQDAEIGTLQDRIGKGERLLQDARGHWQAVAGYERAEGQQRAGKAEVDRLEALVEQLGPNGVRVKALAEALGTFEAAVNPYVEPFGWTLTFDIGLPRGASSGMGDRTTRPVAGSGNQDDASGPSSSRSSGRVDAQSDRAAGTRSRTLGNSPATAGDPVTQNASGASLSYALGGTQGSTVGSGVRDASGSDSKAWEYRSTETSRAQWQVLANGRPVETYSRSERYRIGIALQMGIAMLSGLKFACIDEMDMLDAENRGIVTKMLLQAPLDQILILGTREDKQPLPTVPGVLAYRLAKQEGQSVIVERSAA